MLKEIDPLTNTITLVAPKGELENEQQDFQPGWTVSIVLAKDNRVRALWTLVNLLNK